MGTRSLTVFLDEDQTEIVVLYRHFDGYLLGHGAELKNFLDGFCIVDGYGCDTPQRAANGMNCLATQAVAHFKDGIGQFYLYGAGSRDIGEEYVYTVSCRSQRIHLRVQAGAVAFFGLPGTKQGNMPPIFNGFIEDFVSEVVEGAWREQAQDVPNDFLLQQNNSPETEN